MFTVVIEYGIYGHTYTKQCTNLENPTKSQSHYPAGWYVKRKVSTTSSTTITVAPISNILVLVFMGLGFNFILLWVLWVL